MALTEQMAEQMLKMQEEVNTNTSGKKWRNKNHAWYLAALEETIELLESTGWYWWKPSAIDEKNIQVELVDLMAFTLSFHLQDVEKDEYEDLAWLMAERSQVASDMFNHKKKLKTKVKDLTEASLMYLNQASTKYLNLNYLLAMIAIMMPIEEFYRLYIGKAVLNSFRQSKGYAKGDYTKNWDGKEDNVYMKSFVTYYKGSPEDLPKDLREYLEKTYEGVTVGH